MQNIEEKRSYSWLLLVILFLALGFGYYSLGSPKKNLSDKTKEADIATLNVIALKVETVNIKKSYIGYVTPINEVDVLPYINGFLEDIMVTGGQDVKQGDNLLVIKQDEYKANMDAAKAAVLQAEANYANARVYYDRIKKAGPKATSQTEIDNAKASYLSTQASVAQAKANHTLAKVNYDYTLIQAPITGTVGNVSLTKGDYVSPSGKALFKVIQYDPIRVVFSITDKDYLDEVGQGPLFANEMIKLKLANGEIFTKNGLYKFADNEINRNTNSIAVFADFENADKTLVANAYVDVIVDKPYDDGVLVRQNYVHNEADGYFVYVVNGNQLTKIKVYVVATIGTNYLLRNDFKSGDYLVVDDVSGLAKNQKIKIKVINEEHK